MAADPFIFESLVEVVHRTEGAANPVEALRTLVEHCSNHLGADAYAVHVLDIAAASYVILFERGNQSTRASYPVHGHDLDDVPHSFVFKKGRRFIGNVRQKGEPHVADTCATTMIVPIMRQNSCLGSICVESHSGVQFHDDDAHLASFIAALAAQLLEERRMLILLEYLQLPLDYSQPSEAFRRDLGALIEGATGMRYIALRELKETGGRRLVCIWHSGFGDAPNSELNLDLSDGANPPFAEAVDSRLPVTATTQDVARARNSPHLADIQSFIVLPVVVGKDVFGTLSCAASCPYTFTPSEILGLTTVANCVGVAIANFRNNERARERIFDDANFATSLLTAEVALSVKHEGGNHLSEASGNLILASGLTAELTTPRRAVEELQQRIKIALEKINDTNLTLAKIGLAHKPPGDPEVVQLSQLWRDAFSLVDYRMAKYDITPVVEGEATMVAQAALLRHAFLQLVLNSIDAFSVLKQTRSEGNRIRVRIMKPEARSVDLVLRYSDNATGVETHRLRNVSGRPAVAQDIFNAGVTSKKQGSGFGMPLTRRMLELHQGGIHLIDSHPSRGVTFEIRFQQEA